MQAAERAGCCRQVEIRACTGLITSGLLLVMVAIISIDKLRTQFKGDAEFAVIDPRAQADFTNGHLLAVSSMPLDRLQQLIKPAVPQLRTQYR